MFRRLSLIISLLVYPSIALSQSPYEVKQLRDSIQATGQRIAQLEARRDAIIDSLARGGVMPIPEERDAWPFLVALPSVAYLVGARDHDSGGYRDSFRVTSEKLSHCFGQALLTAGMIHLRVPKWQANAASVLGAIAFELGQRHGKQGPKGYFSGHDLAYGAGCSTGFTLFTVAF